MFCVFQVVTPQRVGNVFQYEPPPAVKGNVQQQEDYDVPPSRYFPETYDTPTHSHHAPDAQGNYNSPSRTLNHKSAPSSKMAAADQEIYDVPPSHANDCGGTYDVPQSNRSSAISMMSTGSARTMSSSTSNLSLPVCSNPPSSNGGSARSSSSELSAQDIYDVPPMNPQPLRKNMDTVQQHPQQEVYDTPPKMGTQFQTPRPTSCDDYDTPRSSLMVEKSKLNTTTGKSLIEEYQVPMTKESRKTDSGIGENEYDTPRSSQGIEDVYDIPPPSGSRPSSMEHVIDEMYDVPTNNSPADMKTVGRVQGLTASGKLDHTYVYDIPPQVTRDSTLSHSDSQGSSDNTDGRSSMYSAGSRSSISSSDVPNVPYEELLLDLDAALELLIKLQQDVHSSTTRLLAFVSSTWRKRENLEPRLYDVKVACSCVKTTLQEFVEFAQGALANSAKAADKNLVVKLHRLLVPIQDTLQVITKSMKNLDEDKWSLGKLEHAAGQPGDDLGHVVLPSKELSVQVKTLASFIQGNATLLFKRSNDSMGIPGRPSGPKPKPPVAPKPKKIERMSSLQERPLPAPPMSQRPLPSPPKEKEKTPAVPAKPKPTRAPQEVYENPYENDTKDWLRDYDYVALEREDEVEGEKKEKEIGEDGDKTSSVHETDSNENISKDDEKKGDDENESKKEEEKDEVDGEMKSPQKEINNTDGVDGKIKVKASSEEPPELTPKQKDRLAALEKESQRNVETDMSNFVAPKPSPYFASKLHPSDRQVLAFYGTQADALATHLTNAIDAFFNCVEYNQGPKVFIAHSKYVIVAAHKLVYIGDTLHRNLLNDEVRHKIMYCANYLCDCLKVTVTTTKQAALQFPSVVAVQEMVDCVVGVSQATNELRLVINQAIRL